MVRLPCSKCGTIDVPKYTCTKNRGNGKRVPYMASFCIMCFKEGRAAYRAKNWDRIQKRMRGYIKEWDEKNRKKRRAIVNKYQRRKALEKYSVEWHVVSTDGYTRLTYD